VYGGVNFGLQKFNFAASVARQMGSEGQAPKLMGTSAGAPSSILTTSSRLSAALSAANLGPGAPRQITSFSPTRLPSGTTALQGVDLRLDQFNLSKAKKVSLETLAGSWRKQADLLGSSFFTSIDASPTPLKADDLALLKNVFNPVLSDRRQDGDVFVPPDASCSYVEKLRDLVKQEESLCQMRKEHFFSTNFVMGNPGSLFPHSWTPSLAVAQGAEGRANGALQACPEYLAQAQQVLTRSAPIFDKSTEEGLRFRIYRQGSIEVRTTQKPQEEEVIGVVFSIRNQTSRFSSTKKALQGHDTISKVTEYVEHDFAPNDDPSSLCSRFFLTLETEGGRTILAEQLDAGNFSWSENPADLEDRRSLAKVTRTQAVTSGVTVQEMKSYKGELCSNYNLSNKQFSRALYYHAAGSQNNVGSTNPLTGTMIHYAK
jgi:hypothetical protein